MFEEGHLGVHFHAQEQELLSKGCLGQLKPSASKRSSRSKVNATKLSAAEKSSKLMSIDFEKSESVHAIPWSRALACCGLEIPYYVFSLIGQFFPDTFRRIVKTFESIFLRHEKKSALLMMQRCQIFEIPMSMIDLNVDLRTAVFDLCAFYLTASPSAPVLSDLNRLAQLISLEILEASGTSAAFKTPVATEEMVAGFANIWESDPALRLELLYPVIRTADSWELHDRQRPGKAAERNRNILSNEANEHRKSDNQRFSEPDRAGSLNRTRRLWQLDRPLLAVESAFMNSVKGVYPKRKLLQRELTDISDAELAHFETCIVELTRIWHDSENGTDGNMLSQWLQANFGNRRHYSRRKLRVLFGRRLRCTQRETPQSLNSLKWHSFARKHNQFNANAKASLARRYGWPTGGFSEETNFFGGLHCIGGMDLYDDQSECLTDDGATTFVTSSGASSGGDGASLKHYGPVSEKFTQLLLSTLHRYLSWHGMLLNRIISVELPRYFAKDGLKNLSEDDKKLNYELTFYKHIEQRLEHLRYTSYRPDSTVVNIPFKFWAVADVPWFEPLRCKNFPNLRGAAAALAWHSPLRISVSFHRHDDWEAPSLLQLWLSAKRTLAYLCHLTMELRRM